MRLDRCEVLKREKGSLCRGNDDDDDDDDEGCKVLSKRGYHRIHYSMNIHSSTAAMKSAAHKQIPPPHLISSIS